MPSSPSTYSVGLNHVGSYQVSGRPWIKHLTLAGNAKTLVELPKVTERILISNDYLAGNDLDIAYCEPKRAIDFTSTAEYYDTSFSTLSEFSISLWIKTPSSNLDIASKRIIDFNPTISTGTGIRTGNGRDIRFTIDGITTPGSGVNLDVDTWYHLTLTVKSGECKLFVNGQKVLESTSTFVSANGLEIGDAGGAGFDGIYSDMALFGRILTETEVYSLWNNGGLFLPKGYSNLVSFWEFEDGTAALGGTGYKDYYSTPDTTSVIYDRMSGNNLSINIGGTPSNIAFVDGRLIEEALISHKITLSGQEKITLTNKSKQVFLRNTGGTPLDLSIFASLTSIPASRMYDLTGPGIDE